MLTAAFSVRSSSLEKCESAYRIRLVNMRDLSNQDVDPQTLTSWSHCHICSSMHSCIKAVGARNIAKPSSYDICTVRINSIYQSRNHTAFSLRPLVTGCYQSQKTFNPAPHHPKPHEHPPLIIPKNPDAAPPAALAPGTAPIIPAKPPKTPLILLHQFPSSAPNSACTVTNPFNAWSFENRLILIKLL